MTYTIADPVNNQPISVSQYGAPVKAAILDIDSRLVVLESVNNPSLVIVKPANEDRANNAVLAIDTDLAWTADPNSMYLVEYKLYYAAQTAGGFQTDWILPSGATGNRSALGYATGVVDTGSGGNVRSGIHNPGTVVVYGHRNSSTNLCIAEEVMTLSTTTGGQVGIRWSQVTSNAANTRMAQGSNVRITKL